MREKLRVLQVIHGFNRGGAETLVKDYLLQMKDIADCKVLCYEDMQGSYLSLLRDHGIDVINLADSMPCWIEKIGKFGRFFWNIFVYLGFRKTIHKWKPDVIHSHLPLNRFIRFAVGKKLFLGNNGIHTLFFHTVHNEPKLLWFNSTLSVRNQKKRRKELKATKDLIKTQGMRLIALHDRMRLELNELFNVDNTVVVNNGIDFEHFNNAKSREEVRENLGIPENAFVLGHVGRFTLQKNHKKIVSVFEEVRKRNLNCFLLLIGDGDLKAVINDEIRSKGLEACSMVLSNRSDIPDLMNAMDVFLFPSKWEGLPVVLIEAQKMKLPCVIADTISLEVIISNLVRVKPLQASDAEWSDSILEPFPSDIKYDNIEEWDMRNVVAHLMKLYQGEE